jgi:hypothetical protein
VYACAAGAVLHEHAAGTLEPAVLLYTFLPVGAADRLREPDARVDVHGDGPGAGTVTVRVLADGQSLSWQLPLAPFVAALPGQPGDEGRMVLLGVVDAEPEQGFWARAVDCERLAAELQLPMTDVVDALRGKLTPWLVEDLDIVLHDDAHEHAADHSPAQTLASAVLALYRGDLSAEQLTSRLVRALDYAPESHQVELGSRLALALVTAVQVAGPDVVDQVLAQTGPFESEVLRLLTELPRLVLPVDPQRDDPALATDLLLGSPEPDETFRAAVSVIARLARASFGPDLNDAQVLQRLGMVDDAGLARLARLWVDLALALGGRDDEAAARALAARVDGEGAPGRGWLARTAGTLAALALDAAGRNSSRIAEPLQQVRSFLEQPDADCASVIAACLTLARFVRSRTAAGPGAWLATSAVSAAQAVGAGLAEAGDREPLLDLLLDLLESDVEPPDLLEALVCAASQLLVHVDPHEGDDVRRVQVAELLTALPAGPRGARWLMAALLREAPVHDSSALDLSAFLPSEPTVEPDRAAARLGRQGLLRSGLDCLDALAGVLGPDAQMPREELLGQVLPSALAEHDLLRVDD